MRASIVLGLVVMVLAAEGAPTAVSPVGAPAAAPAREKVEFAPPTWRSETRKQADAFLELLAARTFDEADAMLGRLVAAKSVTESGADLAFSVLYRALGNEGESARDDLEPHLDAWVRDRPKSSFALTARARLHRMIAWRARGGGFAAGVKADAWPIFRDRLARCSRDLLAAVALDPRNYLASCALIESCIDGSADEKTMETWFARTIALHPTMRQAFHMKAAYLAPKWHGTREKLLAFVRAASASAPKGSAIPVVVQQAHRDLAITTPGTFEAYFADPAVIEECQKTLERLDAAFPKSGEFHRGFGEMMRKAGRADLAKKHLDIAVAREPQNPEILTEAGLFYEYLANDEDTALELYNRAADADPGHIPALRQRIGILQPDRLEPVSSDLRKLRVLAPHDVFYAGCMGALYKKHGDAQRAFAEYDAAVNSPAFADEPAVMKAHYLGQRGVLHAMLGRADEAIRDLTRAIELEPTRKYFYMNRANCYDVQGRKAEAAKDRAIGETLE